MNTFSEEKVERSLKPVKNCLREMVAYLGTGFHPDTKAEDYIRLDDKRPTFTPTQCEVVNHNLDTIHAVLSKTVYAEAIELWHEMGMIDNEQYLKLQDPLVITKEAALAMELDIIMRAMEEVNMPGTFFVSPEGTSAPAALIMMRGAIPETHDECVEFLSKKFKEKFQFFQEVPLGIITVWSR